MDAGSRWTGLDPERLARIGDYLQHELVDPGRVAGCQIAIARHGHVAYARSFGLMDLVRGRPVREDTVWRIYSMTKPITSVALMTLYEQGRFQLDEPVARYVPSWSGHRVWASGAGDDMVTEAPRRLVTFRDLLRHTAGLTYGGLLGPDADLPVDAAYRELGIRASDATDGMAGFLDKLARVPLAFQPGTAWLYSLATDACGALVEVISGRPFADVLRDEIFEPLGMADTGFHVAPDRLERLAASYRAVDHGALELLDDPPTSPYAAPRPFKSGGAGLVSTTADYLRFCEMLRRGGELDGRRVLGPRTLEMMHMNHLPNGLDLAQAAFSADVVEVQAGVGFGLGFAVNLGQVPSGGPGAGAYSWGGAASTLFWVDPREDLSVVFMTQLSPSGVIDFRGPLRNLVYAAIID